MGKITIHNIGSYAANEGVRYSKQQLEVDELVRELLKQYFLLPYKVPQYYRFVPTPDQLPNPLAAMMEAVFEDERHFHDVSRQVADHLYLASNHPKIRSGEFYMVSLRDCELNGETIDAIGLFKSENKETFLKVFPRGETFEVQQEKGININRLDKGCLVFNTQAEDGYRILVVDNLGRGQNAQYWTSQFLGIQPVEDNYFQTQNYLRLTKGFVDEVFNTANEVERADQIDLLNRSVSYFKSHDQFDEGEFQREVMQDEPQIVEAFADYKKHYESAVQTELPEQFPISDHAVRKEKGRLRSILKLDRNFHVYIHGDRNRIEKGWDEARGMKFYKLYFTDEE